MDSYRQKGLAQGNSRMQRGDLFAQTISTGIMDSRRHRRRTMIAQEAGSSVPRDRAMLSVNSYYSTGTRESRYYDTRELYIGQLFCVTENPNNSSIVARDLLIRLFRKLCAMNPSKNLKS